MEKILTEIEIEQDIRELVPNFLLARKSDLEKINQSLINQDFAAAAKICHTIKGIAKPFGFPTLEKLVRELELASRAQNIAQAQLISGKINMYLRTYSSALQN